VTRNRPQRHEREGGIDPRTGHRRANSTVNPDVPPPSPPTAVDVRSTQQGVAQLASNHPSHLGWAPIPVPQPAIEWPAALQGFEHLPAVRDAFDGEIITEAAARRFVDALETDERAHEFLSPTLTPKVIGAAINVATAEYNNNPDHNFANDLVVLLDAARADESRSTPRRIVAFAAAAYQRYLMAGRKDFLHSEGKSKEDATDPNLSAAIDAYNKYDPELGHGSRTLKLGYRKAGVRPDVVPDDLIESIGENALQVAGVTELERHSNGLRAHLANGYLVEMASYHGNDSVTGYPDHESEIRRVHLEADGTRTVVGAVPFYRGEEQQKFLMAADPRQMMRA
jgi:hypothetical protein